MVPTPNAGAPDGLPRPTDEWMLAAAPPVALVVVEAPVFSGDYHCCGAAVSCTAAAEPSSSADLVPAPGDRSAPTDRLAIAGRLAVFDRAPAELAA